MNKLRKLALERVVRGWAVAVRCEPDLQCDEGWTSTTNQAGEYHLWERAGSERALAIVMIRDDVPSVVSTVPIFVEVDPDARRIELGVLLDQRLPLSRD